MKKKAKIFIVWVPLCLAVVVSLIWAAVNFWLIPKVVLPKIMEFVKKEMADPVSLSIGDVYFSPVSGFMFKDLAVSGPVVLRDGYIFKAKTVDIDIALLPLLRKRIEVLRFEMLDVDLNVGRDAEGNWNFHPLLELEVVRELIETEGQFDFYLHEITIERCFIDYIDLCEKDNTLERRYRNVEIAVTSPRKGLFRLELSGGAKDRKSEGLDLVLDYDQDGHMCKGRVEAQTIYLVEYWDYYLDEILQPWHLKADKVTAKLDFVYESRELDVQGGYAVSNGVLSYGDLSIRGDVRIKQALRYLEDQPRSSTAKMEVDMDDITSLTGKYVFLEKGQCLAVITETGIDVLELTGHLVEQDVDLKGRCDFSEPKQLKLYGDIGHIHNEIKLIMLSENEAKLEWEAGHGGSYIKISADMPDVQNLNFTAQLEASGNMKDVCDYYKLKKDALRGIVTVGGNIEGEVDKKSSIKGEVDVNVMEFSALKLKPASFKAVLKVEDGLFTGNIPKIEFYQGYLSGQAMLNFDKWGMELRVDDMDFADLVSSREDIEDISGIFTGNVVCVGEWGDSATAIGGGYFKFSNCNIWNIPVLHDIEEGIEEAMKNPVDNLPTIKLLEGNFEVKDRTISINDVLCQAQPAQIQIRGKITFDKDVEMTAAISFSEGFVFRTARQILVPPTIALDLLANSFKVDLFGKLPDLEHKVGMEPAGWFKAFLPATGSTAEDKYGLEEIWEKGLAGIEEKKVEKQKKREKRTKHRKR